MSATPAVSYTPIYDPLPAAPPPVLNPRPDLPTAIAWPTTNPAPALQHNWRVLQPTGTALLAGSSVLFALAAYLYRKKGLTRSVYRSAIAFIGTATTGGSLRFKPYWDDPRYRVAMGQSAERDIHAQGLSYREIHNRYAHLFDRSILTPESLNTLLQGDIERLSYADFVKKHGQEGIDALDASHLRDLKWRSFKKEGFDDAVLLPRERADFNQDRDAEMLSYREFRRRYSGPIADFTPYVKFCLREKYLKLPYPQMVTWKADQEELGIEATHIGHALHQDARSLGSATFLTKHGLASLPDRTVYDRAGGVQKIKFLGSDVREIERERVKERLLLPGERRDFNQDRDTKELEYSELRAGYSGPIADFPPNVKFRLRESYLKLPYPQMVTWKDDREALSVGAVHIEHALHQNACSLEYAAFLTKHGLAPLNDRAACEETVKELKGKFLGSDVPYRDMKGTRALECRLLKITDEEIRSSVSDHLRTRPYLGDGRDKHLEAVLANVVQEGAKDRVREALRAHFLTLRYPEIKKFDEWQIVGTDWISANVLRPLVNNYEEFDKVHGQEAVHYLIADDAATLASSFVAFIVEDLNRLRGRQETCRSLVTGVRKDLKAEARLREVLNLRLDNLKTFEEFQTTIPEEVFDLGLLATNDPRVENLVKGWFRRHGYDAWPIPPYRLIPVTVRQAREEAQEAAGSAKDKWRSDGYRAYTVLNLATTNVQEIYNSAANEAEVQLEKDQARIEDTERYYDTLPAKIAQGQQSIRSEEEKIKSVREARDSKVQRMEVLASADNFKGGSEYEELQKDVTRLDAELAADEREEQPHRLQKIRELQEERASLESHRSQELSAARKALADGRKRLVKPVQERARISLKKATQEANDECASAREEAERVYKEALDKIKEAFLASLSSDNK